MSALEILLRILSADSALSSAVGDKIYPVVAPQGTAAPYIVLSRVFESEGEILAGASGILHARLSVAIHASNALDAELIGEAVKRCLHDVTNALVSGGSPPPVAEVTIRKEGTDLTDYSDDLSIRRRLMDFEVFGKW